MCVCIGICERQEEKVVRLPRLWVAGCAEPSPRGWCGGPAPGLAPGLAGHQPAPIPSSLRIIRLSDCFYL
ncbi:hypothetical protein HanIR_Chr02g0052441 [Helianthus annuus]|nr:hypothetical protein HanIR_Chr02g0052441 [Helianthus annuus]